MYKNILVPIALEHKHDVGTALDIAHKLLDKGGTITALHVMQAIPSYAAAQLPLNYRDTRESAAMAALQTELGGVSDISADVATGHAGRTIQDYARRHDCDCIIMASHRPGIQDYFLGSTAAWVVRHSGSSVHVIRD